VKAAAWTRTYGHKCNFGAEYSFRRFGFSFTVTRLTSYDSFVVDAWFLFFGATLWISRKGWNE